MIKLADADEVESLKAEIKAICEYLGVVMVTGAAGFKAVPSVDKEAEKISDFLGPI